MDPYMLGSRNANLHEGFLPAQFDSLRDKAQYLCGYARQFLPTFEKPRREISIQEALLFMNLNRKPTSREQKDREAARPHSSEVGR